MDISIEEIKKHLSDRWWRINNLYYIKDKKGNKVLFKPNEVQKEIHDNLWFFNIIPKARQLGVTTFFAILYLDQILFSENKTAGIIAHRQEDMKKIFRNKIRFAWDNLHPWLKAKIGEPNTDSAYELVFPNGSSIFVSMTTRSGTIQFLHISEFGYICQKFPEKAEEIVTGAINSVDAGQMVSIESTAAGREGYFYEFCMDAQKAQKEGKALTPLDFKLFFFPWWVDPTYEMNGENFLISEELTNYFTTLEQQHGLKLTDGQKRWYSKKWALNKDKMQAEYPSTIDEAFSVSLDGSYYAREMSKVYLERRIQSIPHDSLVEVDTWWDLGMNDFNVILFTQGKGAQIRFIDMYFNRGEGLAHYVDVLKDRRERNGYRYGAHHLPHDVEVKELNTGLSRRTTLFNLGLRNIKVGAKLGVNEGIDKVRGLFSRFYFDEFKCAKLHEALFNYRKDFDAKLGAWKDKPRHDDNSHFADAVRLLGIMWRDVFNFEEIQGVQTEQSFFG